MHNGFAERCASVVMKSLERRRLTTRIPLTRLLHQPIQRTRIMNSWDCVWLSDRKASRSRVYHFLNQINYHFEVPKVVVSAVFTEPTTKIRFFISVDGPFLGNMFGLASHSSCTSRINVDKCRLPLYRIFQCLSTEHVFDTGFDWIVVLNWNYPLVKIAFPIIVSMNITVEQ